MATGTSFVFSKHAKATSPIVDVFRVAETRSDEFISVSADANSSTSSPLSLLFRSKTPMGSPKPSKTSTSFSHFAFSSACSNTKRPDSMRRANMLISTNSSQEYTRKASESLASSMESFGFKPALNASGETFPNSTAFSYPSFGGGFGNWPFPVSWSNSS